MSISEQGGLPHLGTRVHVACRWVGSQVQMKKRPIPLAIGGRVPSLTSLGWLIDMITGGGNDVNWRKKIPAPLRDGSRFLAISP